MRHDIYRAREGAKRSPYNELDHSVEDPEVLKPHKSRSAFPWRLESGHGWGGSGDVALVTAAHDNANGVEGSSVVLTTRDTDEETLRFLGTAANYLPRAIELLKAQLKHTAHGDNCGQCHATRVLLSELGVSL
jgi:hypothetical protein